MKLKSLIIGGTFVALIGGGVSWATAPNSASATTASHTVPAKVCNPGWTQNPDETSRKPVQKPSGMVFSSTDLIHHAASLNVKFLHPGSFHAFPAPDQPSFFSVEVYGTDGGYATLRWNPSTAKWEMSTGGQFYTNASPAALVDMVTPHKSHHVISFGVGFTANPPGTVTTLVSSVTFNHRVYWLGCKPPHHHRPTHTPTPPVTVTPTPKPSIPLPTPTQTVPGEAPAPTPVESDLPVTG